MTVTMMMGDGGDCGDGGSDEGGLAPVTGKMWSRRGKLGGGALCRQPKAAGRSARPPPASGLQAQRMRSASSVIKEKVRGKSPSSP